jgi:signal transduction histidine kinase
MIARDERVIWFHDEAQLVQLEGRPMLRGILLDVTERAHAEEEARRAEAETQGLVRRLSDTVAVLNATDEARRGLVERLVAAREEEHRRIAAEVHDGPVQKMVAAGLRLQMFLRRELAPEDKEELANLSRVVTATIAEMRQLLLELVPSSLDTKGLAVALRELLERLGERHGLQIGLEDGLATEPTEPWRTVCYRIGEDALRHIGKNAGATTVSVTLADGDSGLRMRIVADGAGLDPEDVGLVSARDRAALAGGRLEVSNELGAGTTLDCWLPTDDS